MTDNLNMALEILNEMLIKEHLSNNFSEKKTYTKEELIMFCKKLLLEVKKY